MKPLADFVWMNGELVAWAEAKVHALTHALHYGTATFEGIRAYDTPDGPQIFRLGDHLERLLDSARIYGLKLPYDRADLAQACKAVMRANNLQSAYIRPLAFLGECGMGVVPAPERVSVDVIVAAFPWGAYLGEEGVQNGVDICVSSWSRVAPNTIPAGAKMAGNYLSSYLIGKEARERGFAEGLGVGTDGLLSEGAAENLFLVRDDRLMTPPTSSSILSGITRDTVIKLARGSGLEVVETPLPREALYVADEVFLTGTGAEITPVRSVDRIETKLKAPGPATKHLMKEFHGLFDGSTPDHFGWLEPVGAAVKESQNAYA
jgi:branched-chain amino acid aminotransferase